MGLHPLTPGSWSLYPHSHLARNKRNQIDLGEHWTFIGCPWNNVNFRLGDGVGAKRERGLNVASLKTVQWSMGICPTRGSHLPHSESLPNVLLPQVPFSIPNCSDCECVQARACLSLLIYQRTPARPNTHPLLPQGLLS